jgi:hypothetical protein
MSVLTQLLTEIVKGFDAKGEAEMKMHAKVLAFTVTTISTKQGKQLEKARVKVQDTGNEVNGDLMAYWVDFLGEQAPTEVELGAILHEEVEIDVRRVSCSKGRDGGVFLNITGGNIWQDGKTIQGQGR